MRIVLSVRLAHLSCLAWELALMGDQRVFANPLVGTVKRTVGFGQPHQPVRARCISLASVGKVIALGCTVVSTMTLEKSAGLAAPVRVATERLSWISAARHSSPIRWRQRVRDERSKVSCCWKTSSP